MSRKTLSPLQRSIHIICILSALWTLGAWAQAAKIDEPILKLEIGGHLSMVNRIQADAGGRYLLTVSSDKTARVWDILSGQSIRVLRPWIGPDKKGMLYSGSVSSDGRTIAVGGWTQNGVAGYEVFFFERDSGKLVRRITGLPQVALHIEFSPDGKFLAVGMAEQGFRIYNATTLNLVATDQSIQRGVEFLEFNRNNKLVVSGHDGLMRLYRFNGQTLSLLAKKSVPGGQMPRTVRFSPDGSKIAVGFDDSTVVSVLNGETLELVSSPETPSISRGTLSSVAWSIDGQQLFAAGEWHTKDGYLLRRWQEGGAGSYRDIPVGASPVVDIRALPDGSLAYATKSGVVGVIDPAGNNRTFGTESAARFVADPQSLRLSDRADLVQFRIHNNGGVPLLLNVAAGTLTRNVDSSLSPANYQAPGISITHWEEGGVPRLNGRPLPIKSGEEIRGLTISADAKLIVLGTDWAIYAFNRAGKELWQVPSTASVVGINISGNGRYSVAALDDGTLRWIRTSDGKEIFAVFLHADGQRWLAWTPTGEFDASPGAEALFGWHLNKESAREAEFVPAATFRSRYYRPGLVANMLGLGTSSGALAATQTLPSRPTAQSSVGTVPIASVAVAASKPAPTPGPATTSPFSQVVGQQRPIVTILSPQDNHSTSSQEILIRYTIESPGHAPVKTIYAVVNDQTIAFPVTRNLEVEQKDKSAEIAVTVPAQDSDVMLFAENANGLGPPAILHLKWSPANK